ncbi:MAG: hypothetical protein ACK5HO_08150, partial [Pseudomonadota bacterium]
SKIDFRTGMYHDTIPPQKSIFEFALRARKITILGALATQFHEICGLGSIIFSETSSSNVGRKAGATF